MQDSNRGRAVCGASTSGTWRGLGSRSAVRAKLQCLRGAVRALGQERMPGPHDLRRTRLAEARARRVRRAIRPGAKSPGDQQSADSTATDAHIDGRPRHADATSRIRHPTDKSAIEEPIKTRLGVCTTRDRVNGFAGGWSPPRSVAAQLAGHRVPPFPWAAFHCAARSASWHFEYISTTAADAFLSRSCPAGRTRASCS